MQAGPPPAGLFQAAPPPIQPTQRFLNRRPIIAANRKDPDIWTFCQLTREDIEAEKYFKQLGMFPTGQMGPNGEESWGICSQVGSPPPFNPARPGCMGVIVTHLRTDHITPTFYYRCSSCHKRMSMRNGTHPVANGVVGAVTKPSFFARIDALQRPNYKIGMRAIAMIIYHYAKGTSLQGIKNFMDGAEQVSDETLTDWANYIREVALAEFNRAPAFGGPGSLVQIDESLFKGCRKYGHGRLLAGNLFGGRAIPQGQPVPRARNNYLGLIDGPWVFGMLLTHPSGISEKRFIYVDRRDRATLKPLILRHIAPGTTIHSDEWGAYIGLDNWTDAAGNPMRYTHEAVNHTQHFVDPVTGAHTQAVERAWKDAKHEIMQKRNGCTDQMFPSYLAWHWMQSTWGEEAKG